MVNGCDRSACMRPWRAGARARRPRRCGSPAPIGSEQYLRRGLAKDRQGAHQMPFHHLVAGAVVGTGTVDVHGLLEHVGQVAAKGARCEDVAPQSGLERDRIA